MTVGGVLNQALGLYQRFFMRFAAMTAVVIVVLSLISAVGALFDDRGARFLWSMVALVITFLGVFLLQGALTLAIDDVRDGRIDTSIGELFSRTRPHLGALAVAGVLAAIGITIGLILFIAPGLYLLTRWALIVPVIVLEDRSAGESFTRSNELTSGRRWAVLGIVLVTVVASFVIQNVLVAIFAGFMPDFYGVWIGSLIANVVTVPFLALAWTVMYFDLRRDAEREPAEVISPPAPV